MNLFKKIRTNRAKKQLNKALEIISKLSWEELDSILPRTDYKYCFDKTDWSNVKFKYPFVPTEKGGNE
jgi:hypothetical protein